MPRNPNTTTSGGAFADTIVQQVWEEATPSASHDPNVYRSDTCGAWIERGAYGNTKHHYGWEIDHKRPVSLGGSDDLANLQPLHWRNNRGKADKWPKWTCTIGT